MLEVIGVTKKFGGLVANNNVSFRQEEGEIMGVIGSNGSGKTTMFNMITGFLRPTSGEIRFLGEDMSRYRTHEIVYKGISRTFQLTSILPDLTVEDNVLYGSYSDIRTPFLSGIFASKGYREQERAARERVDHVLELLKLDHRRRDPAKNIASAEQRKLMIAIAMACKPRLLLLDEPAAGTSAEEQDELTGMIRSIRDAGTSVLIIEHNMRLIMQLCDHIVAFDFGEKIGDGTPDEIKSNQAVIDAYLGKAD
jgi:branched-chain amino acid transport system ATP-binding protein